MHSDDDDDDCVLERTKNPRARRLQFPDIDRPDADAQRDRNPLLLPALTEGRS